MTILLSPKAKYCPIAEETGQATPTLLMGLAIGSPINTQA